MDEPTLQKVLSSPKLPTLPTAAMEILRLAAEPQLDLNLMADIVSRDQALSARVLRTANSSFYARSKPCTSIQESLVYLGVNAVRTVVLGFSLHEQTRDDRHAESAFDFTAYWRRGLLRAAAARAIAHHTEPTVADEAFLGGLLADVGMIAMLRALHDQYSAIVDRTQDDHDQLSDLERSAFDFDHAEVGAALLEQWALPQTFSEMVRHHHQGDAAPETWRLQSIIVDLAGAAAECYSALPGTPRYEQFQVRANTQFNLEPDVCEAILDRMDEEARSFAPILEIELTSRAERAALLTEAEELRIHHQARLERERELLERSNTQLARQATTDPLTGLTNRETFDKKLRLLFAHASDANESLAIILLDVDRFKLINDKYGHPIGDIVLAELARLLQHHAGENNCVARYGGEEFTIILAGASCVEATRFAERLRRTIGDAPLDLSAAAVGPHELPITVSIGVAVYDQSVRHAIETSSVFFRLVDRALYAAKQAGRNCVRVLMPNVPAAGRVASTGRTRID